MVRKHIITTAGQVILAEDITHDQVHDLARQFYDGVGGHEMLARLATRFYELVTADDELSPLFEGKTAENHAARLTAHLDRMYGTPDLLEGWSLRFLRAHTTHLFSNRHRARWLELMRQAGTDVGAPDPWFSDFMGTLTNASGVVLGISRGAALERGEEFDREGRPLEGDGQ